MEKIKYYVSKENKVVVAYVSGCREDAMRKLACDNLLNKYYIDFPNNFRGVAKLKDGDEWDEEKGRQVAKAKLLRAYHREMKNSYLSLYEYKLKELDPLFNLINKHDVRAQKLDCEITKY